MIEPPIGSRWVWEIDKDHARALVEVLEVLWNGDEWWVRTKTLPPAPVPMFGEPMASQEDWNELDRFWEAVSPVGAAPEGKEER